MLNSLSILIAICLYVLASVFTALSMRSLASSPTADEQRSNKNIITAFSLATIAVICHLIHAYNTSLINQSLNLSLSSMVVLVSGLIVVLFLLGGLAMPIRRLGILVYPITVACLLFSLAWGDQVDLAVNKSWAFSAHILIALSAYALLTIASIQALLYVYQDRQIKNRTNPAMLTALPPLQTMEQLLFRLVGFGFFCLTLTMLSGAIFSKEIFGHAFVMKHHTVLAILGWFVFAIMLLKRVTHGLRGSQAVTWTIAGFLLIQLGYFGTKIVSESLAVQ